MDRILRGSAEFILDQFEDRILLSADILPIAGEIATPGEIDRYSFSLDEETLVYFDAETSDPNIFWRLDGADGTVLRGSVDLEATDLKSGSGRPFTLAAGEYTFTIDGRTDSTGSYNFRLLDLGAATPVGSTGAAATRLDPEGRARLYKIDGLAGETLGLDASASRSLDWSLIDEDGRLVFQRAGNSVWDSVVLERDGTHYLIVDGSSGSEAAAQVELSLSLTTEPDVASLAVGELAAGRLETPGRVDRYRMTLSAPKLLIYDALLFEGAVSVEVTNQYGFAVDLTLGDGSAINLDAGTYEFTITAAQAQSAYGFRFLDPTALASPLVTGASTHLASDAGAHDKTAFSTRLPPQLAEAAAVGGAVVSKATRAPWLMSVAPDLFAADAVLDLWVRPDTRQRATLLEVDGLKLSTSFAMPNNLSVSIGGQVLSGVLAERTWSHVAVGVVGNTARLFVNGVAQSEAELAVPLNIGTQLAIGGPLDVDSDQRFSGLIHGVRLSQFSLDPAAAEALFSEPLAGDETRHLLRFANGVATDEIAGAEAVLQTARATALQLFAFDLAAGEAFAVRTVSNGANLSLMDPSGAVRSYDGAASIAAVAGTYTLIVDPQGEECDSFDLLLDRESTRSEPLSVGETVTGEISRPLETVQFELSLSAASRVVFEPFGLNAPLEWRLIGSDGTVRLSGTVSETAHPVPLPLEAGTYQLEVTAVGTRTGSFAFTLRDVGQDALAVAPGDTVDIAFTGDDRAASVLRVTPGPQTAITPTFLSGYRFPTFSVFSAEGTFLQTLSYGQTYQFKTPDPVYLVTTSTDSGALSFELRGSETELAGHDIVLGFDPFDDAAPLQTQGTFVDTSGTRSDMTIYTDGPRRALITEAVGNTRYFLSTLHGPGFSEYLGYPDRDALEGARIVDMPVAGTYRLTGQAGFGLVVADLAAAPPLPQPAITETVAPGTDLLLYRLDASAGDVFSLDMTSALNRFQARLIAEDGTSLGLSSTSSAFPRFTHEFERAGTYYIAFQPRFALGQAVGLSIPVTLGPPSLEPYSLGDVVSAVGTNDAVDVRRALTLDAEAALLVQVDQGSVELRGAGGFAHIIDANTPLTHRLISVPAGEVQLISQIANGGTQSLQVERPEGAPALTLATAQEITLNPARSDRFAFTLEAGKTYGFDLISQSWRSSGTWAVFDAEGVAVATGPISDAAPTFSVPVGGAYTLVMVGSGTLEFALRDARPDPVPISLGETVSSPLTFYAETRRYTFTLDAPTRVVIDPLSYERYVSFALEGPSGQVLPPRSFATSVSSLGTVTRPVLLDLEAGSYTFNLTPNSTAFSQGQPVSIRVVDAGTVQVGMGETAILDGPGSVVARIDAVAGAPLCIDVQSVSSWQTGQMMLYDPDGALIRTMTGITTFPTLVPVKDGVYTVVVAPVQGYEGLRLSIAPHVARTTEAALDQDLGTPVQGPVLTEGRDGAAARFGRLSSVTLPVEIAEAATKIEFGVQLPIRSGPVGLVELGSLSVGYADGRLVVKPFGPGEAATLSADYAPGAWADIAVEHLGDTVRLSIDGQVVVSRDVSQDWSLAGSMKIGAAGEIYDPNFGTRSLGVLRGMLDYVRLSNAAGFVAQVDAPAMVAGTPIDDLSAGGAVIRGQLTQPGDIARFTFTLDEERSFYFDPLAYGNMTARILGAGGALHSRTLTTNAVFTGVGDAPLIDLEAGRYTIEVSGAADDFAFRLIDVAAVPELEFRRALPHPDLPLASALYRFDAEAGETVFIEFPQRNFSQVTGLRIIGPTGAQTAYNASGFSDSFGPIRLPDGGQYLFVIDGVGSATAASETFTVSRVQTDDRDAVIGVGATDPDTLPKLRDRTGALSALDFQGNTFADIDGIAADLSTGPVSVDFWLYRASGNTSSAAETVLFQTAKAGDDDQPRLSLTLDQSNELKLWVDQGLDQPWWTSGFRARVPTDSWTHIAAIFDPDARRLALYVNGNLAGEFASFQGGQFFSADRARIGAALAPSADSAPFVGGLDEFRVWDVGLDLAEVRALAQGTVPDTATPIAAFSGLPGDTGLWAGGRYNAQVSRLGGDGIFGRVSGRAETEVISFTLDAPGLIYVDPLFRSPLTARIVGPNGPISSFDLDQGDTREEGQQYVLAAPGEYRLELSSDRAGSVAYGLRLIDLLAAPEALPGVPLDLLPIYGSETFAYQIEGQAGERIFLDFEGGEGTWRLLDPGRQVLQSSSPGDRTVTFERDGTHILLLHGSDGRRDTVTPRHVTVHRYTQMAETLSLGTRVEDVLSQPAEQRSYTFDIVEPTHVLFDALAGTANFYWTLDDAQGQRVGFTRFTTSDHADAGKTPARLLMPGRYTLNVASLGDTDGPFAFRLLDLASAAPITPDVPVALAVGPTGRETQLFSFDALARDAVSITLDTDLTSDDLRWRLFDPQGHVVFGPSRPISFADLILGKTGRYTLAVDGPLDATDEGAVAFTLHLASARTSATTGVQGFEGSGLAYVANGTPSLVSDGAGGTRVQLLDYRDATLSGALWFETAQTGPVSDLKILFDLEVEGNPAKAHRSYGDVGVLLLDAALWGETGVPERGSREGVLEVRLELEGDDDRHDLRIFNNGTTVFSLSDINVPLNSVGPLLAMLDARKVPGGVLLSFTLTAEDGTEFSVFGDVFVRDVDLEDRRLVLSGTPASSSASVFVDDVSVASTAASDEYRFSTSSLVQTDFTQGRGLQKFRFSVENRSTFFMDVRQSSSELDWRLGGENIEMSFERFSGSNASQLGDDLFVLDPGDYWIEIQTGSSFAGTAAFVLHDLAAASPLALNSDLSIDLTPSNGADLRGVEMVAGEELFFDFLARPAQTVYWALVDPAGQIVHGPVFTQETADVRFTPTVSGTYVLLLSGAPSNTQPVTVELRAGPALRQAGPIALDTRIEDNLTRPGERVAYTFTLERPSRVLLDYYTGDSANRMRLIGPVEVAERRIGDFLLGGSATVLPAGTYTLEILAEDDDTGPIAFALRDVTDAPALTTSEVQVVDFEPDSFISFVSFEAEQDARYSLQEENRPFNIRMFIYDPEGRLVESGYGYDDLSFVAQQTGLYRAMIFRTSTSVANANIRLNALDQDAQPYVIGSRIEGAIGASGEVDAFTFTLTEDRQLYVDIEQRRTSDFEWRLIGPGGAIDSRRFDRSDGVDASLPPLFALRSGAYRFEINARDDSRGSYAFRMLDIAQGEPITPGTVVDFTSGPGGETSIFRFNGVAGQSYYLDTRGFTPGSAYVRLVDPGGVIVHTGDFEDVEALKLAKSGTYTLLVEGRMGNSSLAEGAFNLLVRPDVAPTPLSTLDAGPGPDLVVSDLTVKPVGRDEIFSGGQIQVDWTLGNTGVEAATSSVAQRVLVRNLGTGEIVAETVVTSTLTGFASGAEQPATALITLPDTEQGAGNLELTVILDILNAVVENNATGTAEANNVASIAFTSTLSVSPDLIARDLSWSLPVAMRRAM